MALTKAEFNERLRREFLNNDLLELLEAHTLIIGLGGTGVRWAANTRDLLASRYRPDEINKRVQYLFIDSDPHEFHDRDAIPSIAIRVCCRISVLEDIAGIFRKKSPPGLTGRFRLQK
jgi:hypothetical protein